MVGKVQGPLNDRTGWTRLIRSHLSARFSFELD